MDQYDLDAAGWPCPTGDEMGRIDAHAIERCALPGRLLMENAARGVAAALRAHFGRVKRPLVACGGGNNGGDGFAIARVLREWDSQCRPLVLSLADPERQSPEARANLELLAGTGVEVLSDRLGREAAARAPEADLVIDAVFGVGLEREVRGPAAELLDALARARRPTLAVDLPSGWSADTETCHGPEIEAQLIATLGLPKLGLALRAALPPVVVVDIGLPRAAVAAVDPQQHWLCARAAAALLPAAAADAHKGSFGHVLVVGGSEGKTGAAVLAATGAARAGAGLVTAACGRALHGVLEQKLTEAMTLPLPDRGGALMDAAAEAVLREIAARDALILGPGLGTAPETARAIEAILKATRAPCVVDADALNAFEGRPEALEGGGGGPRVLTPHPGEAARLLGRSAAEVQAGRPAAARELARRSRAVVVLKGARTLVAEPGGRLWVNPSGGPGLASGGSGDVLAGAIGGLIAQGLDACAAARLGVWMHGAAGDRGPKRGGLAGEVADALPAVRARLERAAAAATKDDDRVALRPFE